MIAEKKRSYDVLLALVLIGGLISVGVFATFGFAFFSDEKTPHVAAVIFAPDILKPDTGLVLSPHAYENVSITAKNAIVYDVRNDIVLYSRASDEQVPLASITKLMTALVARDTLGRDAVIAISESSLASEGDSGFDAGEEWSLGELIDFMMVTSSNQAAQAIAQVVGATMRTRDIAAQSDALDRLAFIQRMNLKARDLNLEQAIFANATGLDVDVASAGGYASARDVARLMAHLVQHYPDLIEPTRRTERTYSSISGKRYTARNTNQFVNDIPGLIGSKTGFTDLAGGNLVVAYDSGFGHPIIIVVLGSTWEERFSDVDTLYHATQFHLQGDVKQ